MVRYLAECMDCGAKRVSRDRERLEKWTSMHDRFNDHRSSVEEVSDDFALVA